MHTSPTDLCTALTQHMYACTCTCTAHARPNPWIHAQYMHTPLHRRAHASACAHFHPTRHTYARACTCQPTHSFTSLHTHARAPGLWQSKHNLTLFLQFVTFDSNNNIYQWSMSGETAYGIVLGYASGISTLGGLHALAVGFGYNICQSMKGWVFILTALLFIAVSWAAISTAMLISIHTRYQFPIVQLRVHHPEPATVPNEE